MADEPQMRTALQDTIEQDGHAIEHVLRAIYLTSSASSYIEELICVP